jgi:enoyl-CoA hydratase/carnithine racemase
VFETVLFEQEDGIARVTLNRPDRLNAYSVQMRDDLFQVFSALRDDPDVRVVVLRGAGRAYCAGADLSEFGTAPSPTAARRIRFARDVWAALLGIKAPLICAMHGFAFGSGLEMALLCDIRIASQETVFALPEVALGLVPAAGGTQTLPRAVGLAAALDLMLTGRRIDATEALRVGLISQVTPIDALEPAIEELVKQLLAADHRVIQAARQALRQGLDMPLEQGIRLEGQLAMSLRGPRR